VKKFLDLFKQTFPKQFAKIRFPESCGIGLKPASKEGTERLFRAALQYAIVNKRKSVTIVHKGNIMKFTEAPSATGPISWPSVSSPIRFTRGNNGSASRARAASRKPMRK